MAEQRSQKEFSFRNYFIPLTTIKAIHWIIIIGLVVFANMLLNKFLWDDTGYIIQDTQIHNFNLVSAFAKNLYNTSTQYRPIPVLYFSLLYLFFNSNPFFYHLIQLLLHILNAILLFFLFKKFFTKKISFFITLIFLIHPLQVESVSYISSSDNPLFFLFGISALLLSFKNNITLRRITVISILIFLSVLTKETGVLFVFVILLCAALIKKRHITLFLISFIITVGIYYLLRVFEIGNQYTQLSLSPIAGLPLIERFKNIPLILFYYIKNFFYPSQLAIDQLWVVKTLDFSHFYLPLLIDCLFFLLFISLGIYVYKKHKSSFSVFLFFLIWFLFGLAFYSQVIPLDYTVADRWFYFPIVGLLGLIGVFINVVEIRVKKSKKIIWIIASIIIILLSLQTIIRNTNWRDATTLYTHDSKVVDDYDIENNLGTEYFNAHDYPDALIHFKKSEKLFSYEVNQYNLGVVYENMHNLPKAKEYYLMILNDHYYYIDPEGFRLEAYIGLSQIYSYYYSPTENSRKFILKGLKEFPDSGDLWAALDYSDYKLHYSNKDIMDTFEKAKALLSEQKAATLYELIFHNSSH